MKNRKARKPGSTPVAKRSARRFKTVGVLGGMGPEATAYFLDLIVKNTAALRDQDHVPIVVFSLPQIPHRTEAILARGPSPLPLLRRGVRILAGAGAHFAVMPCVTAHYFLPNLERNAAIPFVDLLEETAVEVRRRHPRIRRVGLLATSGTIESRIFHDVFEPRGLAVLTPSARDERRLMNAIYGRRGIKAGITGGRARQTVLAVARGLIRCGAQAVVAGCTEIPLVLGAADISVPLVDPLRVAARACLRKAGAALRSP